jgi:hypothetical protein
MNNYIMNYLNLFVSIIVLIILIYILYYFFLTTQSTINSKMLNLNTIIQPISKIDAPTNVRYAYGAWIYVNNLNDINNTVFSRDQNIRLYIEPKSPILHCDLVMNDGTTQTTAITNNLPIQKWCFIVVSVDNQFIDYYLNGKLIKSEKKQIMMKMPPNVDTPLYLGNSGYTPFIPFDAYLGKVIRWTTPIDPQTAWNTYLSGNGVSTSMMPYHANISFVKDNVTTSTYSLW